MEELEKAEHGDGDPMTSLGLHDPSDQNLASWNASIMCPAGFGKFENRFLELKIICTDNYPA